MAHHHLPRGNVPAVVDAAVLREREYYAAELSQERETEIMRHAIDLARQASIVDKTGGPFAAAVVHDGEIIGDSGSRKLSDE